MIWVTVGGWSSATPMSRPAWSLPRWRTTGSTIRSITGARVYITLPGGKREAFTFQPKFAPGLKGSFLGIYLPQFVPDAGVTSQLTVPTTDLTVDSDGTVYQYYGWAYNPADPIIGGHYSLTTKDGLAYDIDAGTGKIATVGDANDNTLTFTDDGINSSSGTNVTFDADPQGRIRAVVDPAGHADQVRLQCRRRSRLGDRPRRQRDAVRLRGIRPTT